MRILLDRERVQWAINELHSESYKKFFEDPIAQTTKGHIVSVLELYLEQGIEGLNRTYRRQTDAKLKLGSSSLMLGLFLSFVNADPYMNQPANRVYAELYKQWGEFPFHNGLMFGFALIGMLRKRYLRHKEIEIIVAAEKILREFCEDGSADRGLTCFWIALRGYAKGAIV